MLALGYLNFFFFNDTATTEIYTLSLHDALPILRELTKIVVGRRELGRSRELRQHRLAELDLDIRALGDPQRVVARDRKSTRLNSSHLVISYAVFCLKKKKDNIDLSLGICVCVSD